MVEILGESLPTQKTNPNEREVGDVQGRNELAEKTLGEMEKQKNTAELKQVLQGNFDYIKKELKALLGQEGKPAQSEIYQKYIAPAFESYEKGGDLKMAIAQEAMGDLERQLKDWEKLAQNLNERGLLQSMDEFHSLMQQVRERWMKDPGPIEEE